MLSGQFNGRSLCIFLSNLRCKNRFLLFPSFWNRGLGGTIIRSKFNGVEGGPETEKVGIDFG